MCLENAMLKSTASTSVMNRFQLKLHRK
jgi:hypothetical protein